MAKLTGIALLAKRKADAEAAAKAAATAASAKPIQQTGTSATSQGRKFLLPPKPVVKPPAPVVNKAQPFIDIAKPDDAQKAIKSSQLTLPTGTGTTETPTQPVQDWMTFSQNNPDGTYSQWQDQGGTVDAGIIVNEATGQPFTYNEMVTRGMLTEAFKKADADYFALYGKHLQNAPSDLESASWAEILKKTKEQQDKQQQADMDYAQRQADIAKEIDRSQLSTASQQSQAAIEATKAAIGGTAREGVISGGNRLVSEQFAGQMEKNMHERTLAVESAQMARDKALADLQQAQTSQNEKLSEAMSEQLALTEERLVNAQAARNKEASEQTAQAFDRLSKLSEISKNAGGGVFEGWSPDDIASTLGIDVASASMMKNIDDRLLTLDTSDIDYAQKVANLQKTQKEIALSAMTPDQRNFVYAQGLSESEKEEFLNFAGKNPTFGFTKDDDGNILATNPNTGEVTLAYGSGDGWGISAPSTGYRTDRHNNPTAVMYEGFNKVLNNLGYKEGIDYEQGDAFPSNNKLHTIRFKDVETGIKAAIDIIDSQGFYTQGGGQRWTHTAMSTAEWKSLNETQKRAVIKEMYRLEGGSGELFGEGTATTTTKAQDISTLESRIGMVNSGLAENRRKDNLKIIQDAYKRGGIEEADAQLKELEITKWGDRIGDAVTLFNKDISDFKEVRDKDRKITQVWGEYKAGRASTVVVDQAIISLFNKITDPASVVRESEFERTATSLGIMDRISALPQKWYEGGAGLTDENRQDIVNISIALAKGAEERFIEARNTAQNKARGLNVPDEFLFSQLGLNKSGDFGAVAFQALEEDGYNDSNIYNNSLPASDLDIAAYNNLNNDSNAK